MAWDDKIKHQVYSDRDLILKIITMLEGEKPHPEEKKKLWQIIEGDPNNSSYVRLSEDSAKYITNNFLKWMEELVNSTEGGIEAMERAWVDKWKIIERIDSEKS